MTQSYGSKVDDQDCQTAKEQTAGMIEISSLLNLMGYLRFSHAENCFCSKYFFSQFVRPAVQLLDEQITPAE